MFDQIIAIAALAALAAIANSRTAEFALGLWARWKGMSVEDIERIARARDATPPPNQEAPAPDGSRWRAWVRRVLRRGGGG